MPPTAGCVPATTCTGGKTCGFQEDGCGGVVSCGQCSAGEYCEPDQTCAPLTAYLCKPLADCGAGNICGVMDNGCGGTMVCGKCPTGDRCLGNQQCVAKDPVCVPKLACDTKVCGVDDDGCGGIIDCEFGVMLGGGSVHALFFIW